MKFHRARNLKGVPAIPIIAVYSASERRPVHSTVHDYPENSVLSPQGTRPWRE